MGDRGPQGEIGGKVLELGLAPPKERPKPPAGWVPDSVARVTWERIINSVPVDHFRTADLPLLEKYCICEQIYYQALEKLSEDLTITTAKGYELPDTFLTIMNKQIMLQTQLATKLRLTPNSRITNHQAGHGKERVPKNSERQRLMFGGRNLE